MEWDTHCYDYSTPVAILDFQSRVIAIELLQSGARVSQAEASVFR